MSAVPARHAVFDTELVTGEDVAFLRELHDGDNLILFFPEPEVTHHDRERFRDFLAHQYRWAVHTYVVRTGRKEAGLSRVLTGLVMIPLIPVYGILSACINVWPWLCRTPWRIVWLPPLILLYIVKGVGVADGIFRPWRALRRSPVSA